MTTRRRSGLARTILILTIVLLALAVAGFGVITYFRPVVSVTELVEGPVVHAFYSTGTIQPVREYPIRSNTAGTVTDVRVDKGARVKRGDVLAVVTDPALVFASNKAKAELEERLRRADDKTSPVLQEYDAKISSMNDQLEIARREVARIQNLRETESGAQRDLDIASEHLKRLWSDGESFKAQRSAKILEMQRDVDVAKAAVSTAQWNLDQQELRSPIDGVVLDRPTSLGTRLAINDTLMRVADVRPSNLVMRAAVDEEDVTKVHVDQIVRMSLYSFPDDSFTGHVTQIYDQADPDRRTFEIEIKLDKEIDRLSPGMTGELAFIIAEKPRAMIVPSQAVQNGVLWIVRDSRLTKLKPEVGLRSVERTEILSGVDGNDAVVISPIGTLAEGQVVRTTRIDPRIAAGLNKPPPITEAFKAFGH